MSTPHLSRRAVQLQGGAAIAGLALLRVPGLAFAFSAQPGEEVLTWLDQPAPNPVPDVVGTQLHWEALDTWLTPAFGRPGSCRQGSSIAFGPDRRGEARKRPRG